MKRIVREEIRAWLVEKAQRVGNKKNCTLS
jgi:hypothetical protein